MEIRLLPVLAVIIFITSHSMQIHSPHRILAVHIPTCTTVNLSTWSLYPGSKGFSMNFLQTESYRVTFRFAGPSLERPMLTRVTFRGTERVAIQGFWAFNSSAWYSQCLFCSLSNGHWLNWSLSDHRRSVVLVRFEAHNCCSIVTDECGFFEKR